MEHLYSKHADRVRDLLNEHDEIDTDSYLDDNFVSSSVLDSGSFEVREPAYLSVRISGSRVRSGSIDTELFDDIIVPLQGEVRAASPQRYFTRLELVSVTSGSSILHFQPRLVWPDVNDSNDESFTHAVAPMLESSIDQVLDLHDSIENLTTPRDVKSSQLDSLARLASGLTRNDAELEILWRPSGRRRRPSRLGRRGLAYATGLFERREVSETTEVSGYIYAMSLAGEVTLKQNVNRKQSTTYRVQIQDPRSTLSYLNVYSFVRMRVTETSTVDRFGRAADKIYTLVDVLDHQPQLPFDEDGD